jgi:hypothetical protein
MRRKFVLGIATLTSLAFSRTALAQSEPVPVPPGTPTAALTGTVVSSSSRELVVETPTGRERFVVDARSSIPANLSAGTPVRVEFHRLDGDRQHVARVTPNRREDSASATDPREPGRAVASATAEPSLPETASPISRVGLVGLLALGAASALRAFRRGF